MTPPPDHSNVRLREWLGDPAVLRAIELGRLPEPFAVGQVYERVPMILRDGSLWKITATDHTRIRLTQVPGGRRTAYKCVKVDPKPMGNGRPGRGERTITVGQLARHYSLVSHEEQRP